MGVHRAVSADRRNLRQFAHKGMLNSGWATHMVMLTAEEAVQWIDNHTGPRGGAQYKFCKICQPQAPSARGRLKSRSAGWSCEAAHEEHGHGEVDGVLRA
ncbi:hypothetical protein, partial [Streptomyces sp. NPDC002763]|uniref:hypothetical protein n=1 Tax=Streptomyces sp. NPDC002763 TaxID=3154427 RepID=UPI00332EEE00